MAILCINENGKLNGNTHTGREGERERLVVHAKRKRNERKKKQFEHYTERGVDIYWFTTPCGFDQYK